MRTLRFQDITRRFRGRHARPGRKTLSDRDLAERLLATFEQDLEAAKVSGIHFYIQDGAVTLYGTVRHGLDRDLVLSLVSRTPGVRRVVSHLQVREARPQG